MRLVCVAVLKVLYSDFNREKENYDEVLNFP
jgi:hypothetical protein